MNTNSISKDSENYQNDDCLENETQNKNLNNKETKKKVDLKKQIKYKNGLNLLKLILYVKLKI